MRVLNKRLDIAPPPVREAAQLAFVLIFAVASIIILTNFLTGRIEHFSEFVGSVFGIAAGVLASGILLVTMKVLAGRPLWLGLLLIPLALTVAAAVQTFLDYGIQNSIHLIIPSHRPLPLVPRFMVIVGSFYWIQLACVLALLWVASSARKIRLRETELADARAAALQNELSMLRMQLNPHFMCNSLNVISSLIVDNRTDEARRMSDNLAGFLRAATAADDQWELGEEFEVLESYLNIETARFGDRLDVAIDYDDAVEHAAVPNFILQPLVENAVKYGVHRNRGWAEIRVTAKRDGGDLVLEVRNEGEENVAPRQSGEGGGVGLANVRARLSLIFDGDASLETEKLEKGFRATIRLPYRQADERQGAESLAKEARDAPL
ncbi:histidine kinase [Allosphingosinicella flava]|uniref:Histidine kinase n=1 Tax=Allosphingosinicella flava TaxID=2771430 RepID=A0A7T2GLE9_9SPHN|nr:histidine kinase [Sphingosinicella flava]QPQ56016.1 histidine kinase [Sphingosinicella flava]